MDITTFRSTFPEFANTTTYPDAQVTFWLTTGETMLNASIWGSLQDQGLLYYIAHNLVIQQRRAKTAAAGGAPGVASGNVSSKGVDKVNVGYDTEAIKLKNGGMYNQTDYGIQFLQLARMLGAVGIQTDASYVGFNLGVLGNML